MLNIAFLPVYQNPYQHLLKENLAKAGVDVRYLDGMPTAGWLWRERGHVQILHFHWLYGLYMQHVLTPVRLTLFVSRFWLARRLGYRMVWTAHNLLPHRRYFPPMHRFIRRLLMAQAEAVIAHCEYGREELLRLFPRQKPVYVIPHGNYREIHPITTTRTEARRQLDIAPDAFVYMQVGNIARYKGMRRFANAFLEIAGPTDVAVIAGRDRGRSVVEELRALATQDGRLQVRPGFIAEDEMQLYLLAADAMVFTFREALTSGSVILALSYGIPVIVPALGCLPELVSEKAGILYETGSKEALRRAMSQIKERNIDEMGQAARAVAERLDWEVIAAQTAGVYRRCLQELQ